MTVQRSILALCVCVVALWGCQKAAEQSPPGDAATSTHTEHADAAADTATGATDESAYANPITNRTHNARFRGLSCSVVDQLNSAAAARRCSTSGERVDRVDDCLNT